MQQGNRSQNISVGRHFEAAGAECLAEDESG